MSGSKIYFRCEAGNCGLALRYHLKKAIRTALRAENVKIPTEINVLITDNEGIHAINREFRNVDRPTDVLSFPAQELIPGQFDSDGAEWDPETGRIALGDMMLSLEKATEQAEEFGHSPTHEMVYLTVHSVLHLLGYDHMDEGEQKKQMRDREKAIMALLKV